MPNHSRFFDVVPRLLREEDGPTATEYAILLALIVLVAVAAIQAVGSKILNVYDAINTAVPT